MRKFTKFTAFLAAVLVLGASGIAMATNNVAVQTATYEVTPIHELSVSGSPGALIINSATAGSDLPVVVDATTTYSITTNEACHITGVISPGEEMPAGVTLSVALATPGMGTSAGDVVLTAAVKSLVTGITAVAATETITYKLSSTLTAGARSSDTRTVTLTIVTP